MCSLAQRCHYLSLFLIFHAENVWWLTRQFSRYDLLIHHWVVSFGHFTTHQRCKIRIQIEKSCTNSATLICSETSNPRPPWNRYFDQNVGIFWSRIWITLVIVCNLLQKSGNLLARTFHGPGLVFHGMSILDFELQTLIHCYYEGQGLEKKSGRIGYICFIAEHRVGSQISSGRYLTYIEMRRWSGWNHHEWCGQYGSALWTWLVHCNVLAIFTDVHCVL